MAKTIAKKKVLSRLGMIEIDNRSRFSQSGSPFRITPHMQEQIVWSGQLLVYEDASEMLRRLLRIDVDASQIFRVSDLYGCLAEEDLTQAADGVQGNGEEDCLYVEADGSMIHTDEGYREVKVGRTFWQSDCKEKQDKEERGQIERSDYIAQLTDCDKFIELFEPRLAVYRSLRERMVFLTDGAVWMDNWIRERFPNATQILDFFHLMERLAKLAACFFDSEELRQQWLEEQRKTLLEESPAIVIKKINDLENGKGNSEQQRQETLNYMKNNLHRMNYKEYRQRGLFIGSGAIESAHRTLIQDRMKRSGQRWSIIGANNMINLRVCHKSNRWGLVTQNIRIMTNSTIKCAA